MHYAITKVLQLMLTAHTLPCETVSRREAAGGSLGPIVMAKLPETKSGWLKTNERKEREERENLQSFKFTTRSINITIGSVQKGTCKPAGIIKLL